VARTLTRCSFARVATDAVAHSFGSIAERRRPSCSHSLSGLRSGGTPSLSPTVPEHLRIIHLKDVVKGGIEERISELRPWEYGP